jgi:uncharacterized 2Fe-2S/4Fe-4S cluster protein (DUF4445 family)
VFQAAASCGIFLEQPCAGTSACGKCRVRVRAGVEAPGDRDREALTPAELQDGWRLGCALTLRASATLDVPPSSGGAVFKAFGTDADVDPARVPIAGVSASGARGRWGLAVDLGTTTLAAAIIDLDSGRVETALSALNPQAERGADVMSRIHMATQVRDGRGLLESAVRLGVAGLIDRMVRDRGVSSSEILAATVVGNPAMLHLWYGADPSGLGVAPYLGLWTEAIHARAEEVGLPIEPSAPVYVLPCIRSHVGADAVAAAVAVGLDKLEAPGLLIDLGTNSELVLGSVRGTFAASTSAGPAFECAGISCGMRAADGAIDALSLEADGRWSVHALGARRPAGMCGSGLLDAVAELLRAGVIDERGYLRGRDELNGKVPERLTRQIHERNTRRSVTIVEQDADGPAIALDATDIRQLQLAVAAIRAGIDLMCLDAGVAAASLGTVFVAGAFGGFVRKRSLLRLGLLPEVPAERVRTVGNAAGVGARLALLDERVRARAERLARRTRYVELAGRAEYQEALIRRMRFPPGPRAEADRRAG